MKKILLCMLTLMLSISCFTFAAHAQEGQQLVVKYSTEQENLSGAYFHVYRIGELSGKSVVPNGKFTSYSVDYDVSDTEKMTSLAATLSAYILRDDIAPLCSDTTDVNGIADFDGMSFTKGIYLVMADKHHQNGNTYFCEPSLVFLPFNDDESVVLMPKFESVPDDTTTKTVSYKVLKSWVDVNGDLKELEIEVELLCDGEIYDTVVLNESNNWTYKWENLSVFNHWTVTEKYVAEGYVVSLSQHNKVLLLTNSGTGEESPDETTKPDSPADPDDKPTAPDDTTDKDSSTTKPDSGKDEPELPVTGMVQWPVPYLALAGVLFLIIGFAKYRKSEIQDE